MLIVWHLFVVFISPMWSPPLTSELVERVSQNKYVRMYSDPLYLNGGYGFFGPDPPSRGRLVRYQVFDEEDEVVVEGEFPNRANPDYPRQWPRLWYHRHMMLCDQVFEVRYYDSPEKNLRLGLRSYARHLLRKHGGASIKLQFLEHAVLRFADVREGKDPTDDEFYRVLTTVVEHRSQLAEPLIPPAHEWRPPEQEEIPIGVGA